VLCSSLVLRFLERKKNGAQPIAQKNHEADNYESFLTCFIKNSNWSVNFLFALPVLSQKNHKAVPASPVCIFPQELLLTTHNVFAHLVRNYLLLSALQADHTHAGAFPC
jgi:hypothetical protein